jgi:hypothetical protein
VSFEGRKLGEIQVWGNFLDARYGFSGFKDFSQNASKKLKKFREYSA